ncbi:MAG TPA: hypothetical protein VMU95_04330 [Trebonia sp.]|nr:hypothetical protein [Trebonia sp.]
MHDYPLEELGPRAFEQLAVALSLRVLGPGVEAFGSGPDGGREATYTGSVNWSSALGFGTGTWDGYVVIQVKQCESPRDPQSNAAWLRQQIEHELGSWTSEESKRGQFPQYVIFVTNVRLSSTSGSGGIDSINELMRRRVHGGVAGKPRGGPLGKRGMHDWKIWHRDQLNALLTVEDGIRNAFPAMLTAGDVMARLGSLPGALDPAELHSVLIAHARNTLLTERWVNLSEAGGTSRQSVETVIIDLSADGPDGQEMTVLSEILARGDGVLRASMAREGEQRHMVLTGSPGNGKSTISRFITQVYRAWFMSRDVQGGMARDVIDGTNRAIDRLGLHRPANRRWPVRVDLAELADGLGPDGGKSLLRWLCEKVSLRAEADITPAGLRQWLRAWPWLLVLDGLDEVTSLDARRRVVDEIGAFVDMADEEDTDLLVIITTRPTGYTERIAPAHFAQFDLRYLDSDTAASYGRLVTSRRLADDLDRRDQVLARFERHLSDPAMARLMKTPLQVLIMSVILERVGNLPPDRYQLFWRYYETVYDREAAKNTTLAPLLTQHRRSITELHEAVGFALQVRGEAEGDSQALLPLPDLQALAEGRLLDLGHEPGSATHALAEDMVTAAMKRLVLLVPAEHDTVAFEIRSLQELMAGRALSTGTDEEIQERLHLTAPSPHWRNSWVFAAGRAFTEGADSRRDLIVTITETTDKRPGWPGWLCPVGPELAADLLDDGLAATTPKWQRRLIDVALRALTGPAPRDEHSLARGLTAAATGNNLLHIRNALKEALAGTPRSRATAHAVIEAGEFGSPLPDVDTPPEQEVDISGRTRGKPTTVAKLLAPKLSSISASTATMDKVERSLTELSGLSLYPGGASLIALFLANGTGQQWNCTLEALRDQDASLVLELLCGDLDTNLWHAQEALAGAVWPGLSRTPVSITLAMPTALPH